MNGFGVIKSSKNADQPFNDFSDALLGGLNIQVASTIAANIV